MKTRLRTQSYRALLAGARKACPHVDYDDKGYAPRWEDNVLNSLPFAEIAGDFEAGAGRELGGKLRAAHSSAAFAVNTFGPWRTNPSSLHLAGETAFHSLRFEVVFPTGLGGTPPHLDLVAEGASIVAVESKCTEWMHSKLAGFSPSYDRLTSSHGRSPWFEQMQQLRANPRRYKFLDGAQLVKHAFGLMSRFGSHEVRLVYFYWEPPNADDWLECKEHRAEVDDLAALVENSSVTLVPISCQQLWIEWERQAAPPSHLPYLRDRYGQNVPPEPSTRGKQAPPQSI